MIETEPRIDFVRYQFVNQPLVEIQAGAVQFALTGGEDPRPRNREAVHILPQIFHEDDVLAVQMVMVARRCPGIPI